MKNIKIEGKKFGRHRKVMARTLKRHPKAARKGIYAALKSIFNKKVTSTELFTSETGLRTSLGGL